MAGTKGLCGKHVHGLPRRPQSLAWASRSSPSSQGRSLMPILSYVPPLAASLLLLAGIAGIWGKARRTKNSRAKFAPIPIVRPTGEPPRVRFAAIFFAVACLIGTALVPLAKGGSLPTPIPLVGGRAFSWQAVARLSREARAQRLPDFSDLVFHEAIQEGMAFGRSARMPAPDERVYVRDLYGGRDDGRRHRAAREGKDI